MELLPLDSRTDLIRLLTAELSRADSHHRLARPARSGRRAVPALLSGLSAARTARAGRGELPSVARTAVPQPCGC